jgi:DNA-binding NtrC family response regulator
MTSGPKITLRELPMNVRRAAGAATLPGGVTPARAFSEKASPLDLHETERKLIAQALATTNGNITAAAKKLGISRRTLHRKINEMKVPSVSTSDGDGGTPSKTGGAADAR